MSPWVGPRSLDGDTASSLPDVCASDSDAEACVSEDQWDDPPLEISDPEFFGIDHSTKLRCFHGDLPERKVAFDFASTGRRFLGCGRKGKLRCPFVFWIDAPWNPVLTRAILHLWNAESSVDRACRDLLIEKATLEIELENKEKGFRTAITAKDTKIARYRKIYYNFCLAAISICVTLSAVAVCLLLK